MVWRYPCGLDIILRLFLSFFFLQVELSHFSGIIYKKVNGQGIPCGRNSSYSFIPILWKLHRCFGHSLKVFMLFGYNPQIIFCHFFGKLNLAIFRALSITKWMDRGYLVDITPPISHMLLCLLVPLFIHFSFSLTIKISQNLLDLGFWNLVQISGMTSCTVYKRISHILLISLSIFSFSIFLSHSNVTHMEFSSKISQELLYLGFYNLVQTSGMARCIVY